MRHLIFWDDLVRRWRRTEVRNLDRALLHELAGDVAVVPSPTWRRRRWWPVAVVVGFALVAILLGWVHVPLGL